MAIRISTNAGAVAANYHLGVNSTKLERSMARLASGSRINRPSDDAGGLAVSMKLKSAINRLSGAELNIQNGISFLEVQDGILESIGNIIDRMSELKGLSRDVMKNARDQATYNREFKDLQLQLKDMISGTFNGVSLFARYTESKGATETIFDIDGGQASNDHTIDVFTSADGEAGAKVSIHKALAWSALTFNSGDLTSQLEYADGIANVNASPQLRCRRMWMRWTLPWLLRILIRRSTCRTYPWVYFYRDGKCCRVACPKWSDDVEVGVSGSKYRQAAQQHGVSPWEDQGCGHGQGERRVGKVQCAQAGVRGDASPGEHQSGSRPDAH